VSSPLEVGAGRAPQAGRDLAALLEAAGCEVVALEPIGTADQAAAAGRQLAAAQVEAVALAPASWFEDYLVLDLLEECPVPVLLWPLPGMETGALCGTQQLTSFLKYLGKPYCGVFGSLEAGPTLEQALTYLCGVALHRKLRRARIGLAGHRVTGMTYTGPHELALKQALGPRVVPLDLPQFLSRAAAMPAEEAREFWEKVLGSAGQSLVAEADGLDSMQVYLAAREVVAEEGLHAITFGCYPHLMGRVCLAASLLADEGLPVACEGDVNGAVGQLILALLTGQPTQHTDWLDPLPDGTVVFTHCGSGSFCLAENPAAITLSPVRLMTQGVCTLFTVRPGPVTLLSLVPTPDGYQCALLEGEALPAEMVFPGNPLRVQFARPVGEIIEWIFEQGIGHHWVVGLRHVGAEIRALAGLCGPTFKLLEL
jgi:L-fucose isomerase-like protein